MAAPLARRFRLLQSADGEVALVHRHTKRTVLFHAQGGASNAPKDFNVDKHGFVRAGDYYGCLGVLPLTSADGKCIVPFIVLIVECKSHGRIAGSEISHISAVDLIPFGPNRSHPSPYSIHVKQLFASGSFYFALSDEDSAQAADGRPSGVVSPSLQMLVQAGERTQRSRALNHGDDQHASAENGSGGNNSSAASSSTGTGLQSESGQGKQAKHGLSKSSTKTSTSSLSSMAPAVAGNSFDLTRRLQAQFEGSSMEPDATYWWNQHMWSQFESFGLDGLPWLFVVIRGSVEIRTIYVGTERVRLALVGRMSWRRAGRRFLTRGIDDEGHCANFTESEQMIFFKDHALSFVIVRGSVPVFWEQTGLNVGHHKVQLTRGFEATRPAFHRHVEDMLRAYDAMIIVSLLGQKDGEGLLNTMLRKHIEDAAFPIELSHFDVRRECKKKSEKQSRIQEYLLEIEPIISDYKFFHSQAGRRVTTQQGVVRVNCLDCLDRTNLMQGLIALKMLDAQLTALMRDVELSHNKLFLFRKLFAEMWQKSGDQLSRCVTGTATIRAASSASSSGAVPRMLKDVQRSVTRTIRNNFMDGRKQSALDVILGRHDTLHSGEFVVSDDELRAEFERAMTSRMPEYTSRVNLSVFVGTWNVHGGKHVDFELGFSAQDWFSDPLCDNADIFVVGFQEIVDLNAQNMVSTAGTNRKQWGGHLSRLLGTMPKQHALVTSVQLVGICLFVFVARHLLPHVRHVSTDVVKTGAGGKVGNKGGVGVSLNMFHTSMCFVCSHLPSGKSHGSERNSAASDISRRLSFRRPAPPCMDHDYVFWCGDLNYRIEMENDTVRQHIADDNLSPLRMADQLTTAKLSGEVFVDFLEGPLDFNPTYKYDLFKDQYDTSEKARTPSWTDRVLYKGPSCTLRRYARNDNYLISDHRPVYAVVDIQVEEINQEKQRQVRESVLGNLRRRLATLCVVAALGDAPLQLESLQQACTEFGKVAIVDETVAGSVALVTFYNAECARKAVQLDGQQLPDGGPAVRACYLEEGREWQDVAAELEHHAEQDMPQSASKPPPRPKPPRPRRPPPPQGQGSAQLGSARSDETVTDEQVERGGEPDLVFHDAEDAEEEEDEDGEDVLPRLSILANLGDGDSQNGDAAEELPASALKSDVEVTRAKAEPSTSPSTSTSAARSDHSASAKANRLPGQYLAQPSPARPPRPIAPHRVRSSKDDKQSKPGRPPPPPARKANSSSSGSASPPGRPAPPAVPHRPARPAAQQSQSVQPDPTADTAVFDMD